MHSLYPLQLLNSFKVPAFAAHYIRLNSLQDIEDFCTEIDVKHNQFYILGGGSNTLFCGTFPGYVLHVQLPGIEIIEESACKVLVKAAAGVLWHHLVLFCVNKGYGGIENLSLIPGTVGGAPIQNIGAYGVAFEDIVASIDAIEWSTRQKRVLNPTACGFGYRTSFFKTAWKNQYIITSVTLVLHKGKKISVDNASIEAMLASMGIIQPSSKAISDAVIAIRKKKLPDPAFLGNAGSFFENPFIGIDHYRWLKQQYPSLVAFSLKNQEQVKVSAAWLIETAGFKGFRQGDAGVYPLHALVLVNYGEATGQDIIHLANQIKQKIKSQFNITLRTEVNIV